MFFYEWPTCQVDHINRNRDDKGFSTYNLATEKCPRCGNDRLSYTAEGKGWEIISTSMYCMECSPIRDASTRIPIVESKKPIENRIVWSTERSTVRRIERKKIGKMGRK